MGASEGREGCVRGEGGVRQRGGRGASEGREGWVCHASRRVHVVKVNLERRGPITHFYYSGSRWLICV